MVDDDSARVVEEVEKYTIGDDDTEVEDGKKENEDGNKENDEPPNRYNVSSYGWDSDVEGLVNRLKRNDIYVPGFQRGFVWTGPEKSRFIESLILGLPVPNVFLAQDAKTKSLNIVDGQQRLLSLRDYLEGKFYLTGQDIQEELKGCYYSREVAKAKSSKILLDNDARALADAVLHSIVIKPDPSHDDPEFGRDYNQAIIQIFRRLNTSGKPLQAHEVRASIFYGAFDNMLREFNENADWRELFGNKHSRLKDMELILRFIALQERHDDYTWPMPKFLDRFMEEHRDMAEERVNELKTVLSRCVKLVRETIGSEGLRSGKTLTVARFDAVMTGFSAYLGKHSEPDKAEVMDRLVRLEGDGRYIWSIDEFVNDTNRVRTRIARAKEIFGA